MAFLHTFSIVARDKKSGQIGVAVQTHWFAVGAMCPWVEPGVGAVATQSLVKVSYGPKGLELLKEGKKPSEALDILLKVDENSPVRQVAILDTEGRIAAHTGSKCIAEAGHFVGDGYSVQANMMLKSTVWHAMAEAFENSEGELAVRMLAALKAGQNEGGDTGGMQSAAMLVADGSRKDEPWEKMVVDIRVDDHPQPILELERLYNIHKAYEFMNEGDELMAQEKNEEANKRYTIAAELAPGLNEIPFWEAVTMVNSGRLDDALVLFRKIFKENRNWAELVKRLPASGLLKDNREIMEKIISTVDNEYRGNQNEI